MWQLAELAYLSGLPGRAAGCAQAVEDERPHPVGGVIDAGSDHSAACDVVKPGGGIEDRPPRGSGVIDPEVAACQSRRQ